MSLNLLSGLLKTASAGFQGYGEDKDAAVKEALQQIALKRQAQQDAVENAVKLGGINPDLQGRIAGARAGAEVDPHIRTAVGTAAGVAPIHTQEAVDTARGVEPIKTEGAINTARGVSPITTQTAINTARAVAPIEQATHRANRVTDLATEPDKVEGGIDPVTGQPKFFRVGQTGPATEIQGMEGKTGTGSTNAPIAARVGQFGLSLRAAAHILPIHDTLVKNGLGVGEEEAGKTVRGESWFSHVPFASEIAGRSLNKADPTYAEYNAALPNFLLGATHAISGARINQEQLKLLASGIRYAPGDLEQVSARKKSDYIDFLNSIRASLPADKAAAEEANMDPAELKMLRDAGYGKAPTGAAYSLIKQVVPNFVPPSGGDTGGNFITSAEAAALKAHGFTDAQIAAKYTIKP